MLLLEMVKIDPCFCHFFAVNVRYERPACDYYGVTSPKTPPWCFMYIILLETYSLVYIHAKVTRCILGGVSEIFHPYKIKTQCKIATHWVNRIICLKSKLTYKK